MIDDDSSLSATFYTQKSHLRYRSPKIAQGNGHSTQAMRWFILLAVFLGFLSSIAASVVIALITKNPLTVALPTSLAITTRPIITHFFPKDPKPK